MTAANGSLDGLVLPSVPENWADLPFKLTASQTESYDSNINSLPIGVPNPLGGPQGDFTSTSNFGLSTRANVSGQQLFFDATFGVIRYLHAVRNDSTIYSLNAGVDWNVTSRCSGTLATSLSKSPGQLTEQVGVGVNFTTTTALNETGRCAVSNGYSLLFNSGLTTTTNSDPTNALNNARTALISAGVEYAKGYSTLTALASISDQHFTGRSAAQAAAGLATETDFHSFTLNYTRQINPNLSVSGTIGLVGVTTGFSLGLPKTLLPIYTVSTTWSLTPKLSLNASASKSISPPTTVVANAQQSYSTAMNLSYQLTPKVSLSAGGAISYSTSSFTAPAAQALISPFVFNSQDDYSLNAGLNYSMTPFLSAALSASYTERVGNHFITPQDVVTVSLNYRPY
ncbi:MAG TPA: outer membrane beta-barrel protein [Roseiarcus sp.]|nr:outer membrane beta-barrel protein [Roseiarcus sp.]